MARGPPQRQRVIGTAQGQEPRESGSRTRTPQLIDVIDGDIESDVRGPHLLGQRRCIRLEAVDPGDVQTVNGSLIALRGGGDVRRADVIAISEESQVTVIDARTGAQLLQKLFNTVNAVAVSPDGRHVLVMTGTLSLTDLASGDTWSPPTRVTAIAGLVRDDRSVIAVQGDRVLRWDGTRAGPVETAATLPARPRRIAFDASGERVAWATGDRFGLVDLASGAALMDIKRPGVIHLATPG